MPLKLIKIIKNNADKQTEYYDYYYHLKDGSAFLIILHPVLAHIASELMQVKKLSIEIPSSTIQAMLVGDFKKQILFMIDRACVYEMHYLKSKNLLEGGSSEERFQYFIAKLANADYAVRFFEKYVVLTKRLSVFIENYLTAKKEMLQRLQSDYVEINNDLLKNKYAKESALTSVITSGDYHQSANAVTVLTLMSNDKSSCSIVYKPQDISIFNPIQSFINWLNKFSPYKISVPNFIVKNNYGWVEYINYNSCTRTEEIRAYYHKLGALLMLAYLLGSTDFHFENIIADTATPYLIDLECIASPDLQIHKQKEYSISSTMINPINVQLGVSKHKINISAFGTIEKQYAPVPRKSWINVNTDYMRMSPEDVVIGNAKNIPKLNGSMIDPSEFYEEFIEGFSKTYLKILSYKSVLLDFKLSPLNFFNEHYIRVIVKPTYVYFKYLKESFHPSLLINHKISDVTAEEDDELSSVEMEELYECDIPYFYAKINGYKVYFSNNIETSIAVTLSAKDKMQKIASMLSKDDLNNQIQFLNQSFKSILKLNG